MIRAASKIWLVIRRGASQNGIAMWEPTKSGDDITMRNGIIIGQIPGMSFEQWQRRILHRQILAMHHWQ